MAVPDSLPFAPVCVETKVIGQYRNMTSVREAAEFLLSADWPKMPGKGMGEAYRAAMQACYEALAGEIAADAARAAFITAARAAGILVHERRRRR